VTHSGAGDCGCFRRCHRLLPLFILLLDPVGQERSSDLILEKDAFYVEGTLPAGVSTSPPKKSLEENASSNQYAISDIREGLRTGGINSNADDIGTKLPDDSNTLFDVPSFQHP
jgi:PERQ amino acid-rich with GYF domain-containing protein